MVKFVLIGIYIFGIACQGKDIKYALKTYKYRVKKSIVWISMIQILIWPLYWLKGFINHYLNIES